jgi:hypothetical protein
MTDGRGQRTDGRGQRTDDRRQMTDGFAFGYAEPRRTDGRSL